MELTFLGTGGGRFTMIEQLRHTGGMHLASDDFSLYIDPGSGALVHSHRNGTDLSALDALLVTHTHLDHCSDMNVLIEAMTTGGDAKSGTLLASESVFDGAELEDKYVKGKGTYGDRIDPVLDGYHESLVAETVTLAGGERHELGPFTVSTLQNRHSDPTTVGVRLEHAEHTIGYTSDTELFEDMYAFYEGCDLLVVNVARPKDKPWKGHLTTEDVATLLNETQPETAVLQHFGASFIYSSVEEQRQWLERQTDVDFVMAEDDMTIDLDRNDKGLNRFLDG